MHWPRRDGTATGSSAVDYQPSTWTNTRMEGLAPCFRLLGRVAYGYRNDDTSIPS